MAISNIFNTTAGANKLYVTHLKKRAVKTLYGQAVLYEQGKPKPLPGGAGTSLIIPKYVGQTSAGGGGTDYGIRPLVEGTLLSATSAAMSSYTGTVAGYGDVRAYSDFIMHVNEIPAFISDEIHDMTMNARRKLDQLAIAVLSGSAVGTNLKADGSTAFGSAVQTTQLKQRALFDANSTLAGNDAIPYDDGTYHGVFHPNQIHDLFVATTGQAATTLGNGYMEATSLGAKNLERASLGILGNVKIYQSTWGAQALTSATDDGHMTGAGTTYQAFIMSPDAFAKVDLETARLKTFWKPAGANSGTYDTIEQHSTAGVKFYAVAVAMDTAKQLCKVVSGGATF